MVLEIALGACSILLLSSLYVNWNLLKKTELFETWIEETSSMVENTYSELQKIDSTGHFESDDEIGTVFEGIKDAVNDLTKLTEKDI